MHYPSASNLFIYLFILFVYLLFIYSFIYLSYFLSIRRILGRNCVQLIYLFYQIVYVSNCHIVSMLWAVRDVHLKRVSGEDELSKKNLGLVKLGILICCDGFLDTLYPSHIVPSHSVLKPHCPWSLSTQATPFLVTPYPSHTVPGHSVPKPHRSWSLRT